jgi:hypothetical protein
MLLEWTQARMLTMVGAGVGAVLAVLAGVVAYPNQLAPLAAVAIGAIGSIVGAGLAVLAAFVRRRP